MKQKYTYAECYRILTLNPGCTWDELRKTYKQQIQKWHPDRFADNTSEKSAADEKIKHITAAYQQLATHYRKHNSLPDIEPPRLAPRQAESAPVRTQTPTPSSPAPQARPIPAQQTKRIPIFLSITLLGFVVYLLMQIAPPDDFSSKKSNLEPQPENTQHPATNTQVAESIQEDEIAAITSEIKTGASHEKFITYGSSIGEVISIQGVPTHQNGDVWYYGESEVYFRSGVVIGWKRAPNSSLKVGLLPVDKQDITKIPLEAPN